MDSVQNILCCLIPGRCRMSFRERERKTLMERRREQMKKLCRLKVCLNYQLLRDRILGRITFDYSRIVVVWTLKDDLSRKEITSKLHLYGRITFIQDRWSVNENEEKTWRGVLVEFSSKNDAKRASLDLPSQFRHLRSTLLETVLNVLADCELLHPNCRGSTTRVVINRKVPLRFEEIDDLQKSLDTYGPMASFFINNRRTTIGAICEVSYTYLTQAYLAMIMTDGFMFRRGILTAVINKTQKETEILEEAKDSIILLSQCDFPN